MNIHQATPNYNEVLAKLVWLDTNDEEPTELALRAFAAELASWWHAHQYTHIAFVAHISEDETVGMAWVALVPRVPRPGATSRLSADIQTVFVLPEYRRRGIGSALVRTATEQAVSVGAARVTVQSGRTAVSMYERVGFQSSSQLLQQ